MPPSSGSRSHRAVAPRSTSSSPTSTLPRSRWCSAPRASWRRDSEYCHCEERSDEAIQSRKRCAGLLRFASLAMTGAGVFCESQSLQPAEIAKFLHALALHLGGVDVAFAVDREIVQVVELAGAVAHVAE